VFIDLKDVTTQTALDDANTKDHIFEEDGLWGKDLAEEFERIFGSESRFVVLFASKEYLTKAWPNHERQSAIAARIKRREAMVLPVVFGVSDIPGLPSSVSYWRADQMTPEDLATRLEARVRNGP